MEMYTPILDRISVHNGTIIPLVAGDLKGESHGSSLQGHDPSLQIVEPYQEIDKLFRSRQPIRLFGEDLMGLTIGKIQISSEILLRFHFPLVSILVKVVILVMKAHMVSG